MFLFNNWMALRPELSLEYASNQSVMFFYFTETSVGFSAEEVTFFFLYHALCSFLC